MLILHELGHVLVYLVLVFVFYKLFLKKRADTIKTLHIVLGLIVTIFLDLDHFIDYFIYRGAAFNLREFISGSYFEDTQKVFVLLHSWELVIGLGVIVFLVKSINLKSVLYFVALGIGVHLVYDTVYYGFNWNSYFLIVRALNGFSLNVLR